MPERYVYEGILSTDFGQMIVDKVVHRNIQTLTDTKQRLNMTNWTKQYWRSTRLKYRILAAWVRPPLPVKRG